MALEDAEWAERGTGCLRRGTAARVVNGTGHYWRAMNHPNLGCTNEPGDCGCSHAEPRALLAAGPQPEKLVLIITLAPCTACANLIVEHGGISEVLYLRTYGRDTRGLQILDAAGIWREQL